MSFQLCGSLNPIMRQCVVLSLARIGATIKKMSESQPIPKPTQGKLAHFPRARALPPHSPLFWVEQKDRYLRQLLIRDIEEDTKRRLIVYFANKYVVGSGIQPSDIAQFAEILTDIGTDPVDLLLETPGGETDATEALIALIRNAVANFRVIVANTAKSNGTLLALAAVTIVMGSVSELGPIEPFINGIPTSILDTPRVEQENFPLHMLGKFALQQSRSLAKNLLTAGMMMGKKPEEIEAAVEALSGRGVFPSHGSVVDQTEAKRLGLKVTYLDPSNELWRRIWLLYCMYDFDCRQRSYLKVFEGRSLSLAVGALQPR